MNLEELQVHDSLAPNMLFSSLELNFTEFFDSPLAPREVTTL